MTAFLPGLARKATVCHVSGNDEIVAAVIVEIAGHDRRVEGHARWIRIQHVWRGEPFGTVVDVDVCAQDR